MQMSGYLSLYNTKARIAKRRDAREERRKNNGYRKDLGTAPSIDFADEPLCMKNRVVIAIDGKYEGVVAKLAYELPIDGTVICYVVNDMFHCFNKEYVQGTVLQINCEDIDWYKWVKSEEYLFTVTGVEDAALLKKVLTQYSWDSIEKFKLQVARYQLAKDIDEHIAWDVRTFYQRQVDTYTELAERACSNHWFFEKALELVAWRPDCLAPHKLEDNTVELMSDKFMDAVCDALEIKKQSDGYAKKLRTATELRRSAVEAALCIKTGLKRLRDFELATHTRVMRPVHGGEDGELERALTADTAGHMEKFIAGLEEVADSSRETLLTMVTEGKEKYSSSECPTCGDELGSAQCMRCIHHDGDGPAPRRPETAEDEDDRRKRPLFSS
jgi:hypothetical protein